MIEDTPAWNPNLRKRTVIRSSDTIYFVVPSIATAAMGIGPNDLIYDTKTMKFLFETMSIRDFRVFTEALDGTFIISETRLARNVIPQCTCVMEIMV